MNEIYKKQREILQDLIPKVIEDSLPDTAVKRILENFTLPKGKLYLLSVGKAGWQMAKTASQILSGRYEKGYLITKYAHSKGPIERFEIFEAGHPVVDENSVLASKTVVEAFKDLKEEDEVILLLSGGGSALFELPLIPFEQLQDINRQLLQKGADIVEINTIRKRLSALKGGKFARIVSPAHITSILLSDVVGDHPDMIASGPAYEDSSSSQEALELVEKYDLNMSFEALSALKEEPVKKLDNVTTYISGGVSRLCETAQRLLQDEGYDARIIDSSLTSEAKLAIERICREALSHKEKSDKIALIYGGETIVHVTGTGLGGRNQEMALWSSVFLKGTDNLTFLALASDGTDGPTDAAGGFGDGEGYYEGIEEDLKNNDAYHGLQKNGNLLVTGPTGTNVNDVAIILIN